MAALSFRSIRNLSFVLALGALTQIVSASADTKFVRYTFKDDPQADLPHVLSIIQKQTGFSMTATDFAQIEDRDLANQHFRMYVQTVQGVPLRGKLLRVWTDPRTGATVQVEAHVQDPAENVALERSLRTSRKSSKG